jgi:cell shape-determining protein MreC
MDIALRIVVVALLIRGTIAAYRDIARGVRLGMRAVRSVVVRAARALIQDWRGWRSYRHRMAVRRRESRERLLLEGQRELVGLVASQYDEIARLRELLEPSPGQPVSMPAQRRPFTHRS